jgi:dynein heavy chain
LCRNPTVGQTLQVTGQELNQTKQPPQGGGVFIYGLQLDGAGWQKAEKGVPDSTPALAESAPKVLFAPLPVLLVTAATQAEEERRRAYLQLYECPCYKYASRTSRYFILSVDLPTVQPPSHWGLRGLALLCSAE